MPYVASTLSSDNRYVEYHPIEQSIGGKIARPAHPKMSVLINGGANVANKLTTPEGVITHISDDEADFLMNHKGFKQHLDNGFVKILSREVSGDVAAEDMEDRDESSQLDEKKGDFEKGGRAAGKAPTKHKVE